jgi:hypothetical protein
MKRIARLSQTITANDVSVIDKRLSSKNILGTDTSFITFTAYSGFAGNVVIYTNSNTKVGTYTISISGQIKA